jgi:activator of HSP90 ATPase
MEKILMAVTLPGKAKRIYEAWLNSKEHTAFTGAAAKISKKPGSEFTAWDGYISGRNIELQAGKSILQSWRTDEFPEGAADSLLYLRFDDTDKGCKLTLVHSDIPDGQSAQYKQGWKDFYFTPMKAYFSRE